MPRLHGLSARPSFEVPFHGRIGCMPSGKVSPILTREHAVASSWCLDRSGKARASIPVVCIDNNNRVSAKTTTVKSTSQPPLQSQECSTSAPLHGSDNIILEAGLEDNQVQLPASITVILSQIRAMLRLPSPFSRPNRSLNNNNNAVEHHQPGPITQSAAVSTKLTTKPAPLIEKPSMPTFFFPRPYTSYRAFSSSALKPEVKPDSTPAQEPPPEGNTGEEESDNEEYIHFPTSTFSTALSPFSPSTPSTPGFPSQHPRSFRRSSSTLLFPTLPASTSGIASQVQSPRRASWSPVRPCPHPLQPPQGSSSSSSSGIGGDAMTGLSAAMNPTYHRRGRSLRNRSRRGAMAHSGRWRWAARSPGPALIDIDERHVQREMPHYFHPFHQHLGDDHVQDAFVNRLSYSRSLSSMSDGDDPDQLMSDSITSAPESIPPTPIIITTPPFPDSISSPMTSLDAAVEASGHTNSNDDQGMPQPQRRRTRPAALVLTTRSSSSLRDCIGSLHHASSMTSSWHSATATASPSGVLSHQQQRIQPLSPSYGYFAFASQSNGMARGGQPPSPMGYKRLRRAEDAEDSGGVMTERGAGDYWFGAAEATEEGPGSARKVRFVLP